jgi:hypothetical protein
MQADIRVGDFIWQTPASESYVVTSVSNDGTAVEVTYDPPCRGLRSGRDWYAADKTVHVAR